MAMPSSLLWAVDIFGRVYTLSTVGQYWELCKDTQLEFKRVSAVKQCCWGIACDHQVYTYVFSGDVPIRYQEETYENQVWQVQYLSHGHGLDWQHILHQLSVCFSHRRIDQLHLFSFFTRSFWGVHIGATYQVILVVFKFPKELHFPTPIKTMPVWTPACFVWAISHWSIHPFHSVVSISPFLSDKYTIPLRKCPM